MTYYVAQNTLRFSSFNEEETDRNKYKVIINSLPLACVQFLSMVIGLSLTLTISPEAIANPVSSTTTGSAPSRSPQVAAIPEVDTSITRDYEPTIIYLPDPQTNQLVPQSVLVTTDEPVTGAVDHIVQSYQGQDMGIQSYEVNVDPSAHQAAINFNTTNPRGARVFQSLSSANQFSLFESIRETLLTQPTYDIETIIFRANGVSFDI